MHKFTWLATAAAIATLMICSTTPASATPEAAPGTAIGTSWPLAGPLRLRDLARQALNQNLEIRAAVIQRDLRAERLVAVDRAQFQPKLSSVAHVRAETDRTGPLGTQSRQAGAGLAADWRLRSGAVVRLAREFNLASTPADSRRGDALNVTLSQPLLRGAGRSIAEAPLQASEAAFRVAMAELRTQAAQAVQRVLLAFVQVQRARAAVSQSQEALRLAQQVHELNELMVGVGRSASSVLLQSGAAIASSRLGVAQAEGGLRVSLRELAKAIGRPDALGDASAFTLDDSVDDLAANREGTDPIAYINSVKAASVSLMVAREAVAEATRRLTIAQDDLKPSLSATLSHSRAQSHGGVDGRRSNSVGLTFEYSFDRAERRLAHRSAEVELELARERLALAESEQQDAAQDALRALAFSREQLTLARTAADLAERQLEADLTRLRLGRASQLDLQSAQQARAAAQDQLRSAVQNVFQSQANVDLLDDTLLRRWGAEDIVEGWVERTMAIVGR